MKVIQQGFTFIDDIDPISIVKKIERIGRVCYKSEEKITDTSYANFIKSVLKRGHESVIEHCNISVLVTTNRGVTHEIVRHRIASYSQESTRYCTYSNDKFGNELTLIEPYFKKISDGKIIQDPVKYGMWESSMKVIEDTYNNMTSDEKITAQLARDILPNSLKTDIVITMNLREWRHFFKLRTEPAAHPEMRVIANQMLMEFKRIPILFDDIPYYDVLDGAMADNLYDNLYKEQGKDIKFNPNDFGKDIRTGWHVKDANGLFIPNDDYYCGILGMKKVVDGDHVRYTSE